MAMRLGYIKGKNGELVPKWVKDGEENNSDFLFRVGATFGDYILTDENNIDAEKAVLLERMLNAVRELAKNDEFWIVKTLDDGKLTVGYQIDFPQMEGYYTWEESERLNKQYSECVSN